MTAKSNVPIFGPHYEAEVAQIMRVTYGEHDMVHQTLGRWTLTGQSSPTYWQCVEVLATDRVVVAGAHVEGIIRSPMGCVIPQDHLRWLAQAKPDEVAQCVGAGAGYAWTAEMAQYRLGTMIAAARERGDTYTADGLAELDRRVWWSTTNEAAVAYAAFQVGDRLQAGAVDPRALGRRVAVFVFAAQEIARRILTLIEGD